MKKLFLLIAFLLILPGCTENLNTSKNIDEWNPKSFVQTQTTATPQKKDIVQQPIVKPTTIQTEVKEAKVYVAPTQVKSVPTKYCCKYCSKGKACGDSCINRSYTCHKGVGCACNSY